jgi:hypothetical protein
VAARQAAALYADRLMKGREAGGARQTAKLMIIRQALMTCGKLYDTQI